MKAPSIFLSAASDDLEQWRNVLDVAFRRAGCHVYTQKKSLGVTGGGVLDLLKQHLDECDYVVHLAGMAYGAEPEESPFPEFPEFLCSYTQFEYYYAALNQKEVFGCVCTEQFPYSPFVENGDSNEERQRRSTLQQRHRQRVASGKFEGTPFNEIGRTLNETVEDPASLMQTLAAMVAKITKDSRPQIKEVQKELHQLGKKTQQELLENAARYQERAIQQTTAMYFYSLVFVFALVLIFVMAVVYVVSNNRVALRPDNTKSIGTVLLNAPGSSDIDSLAGASESDATAILQNCISPALRRIGNNSNLKDKDRWRFVRNMEQTNWKSHRTWQRNCLMPMLTV
jgi:hypothetical protein